jgi:curli biogenesis system outer membrane secretion channel CsgG
MKKRLLLVLAFAVLSCGGDTPNAPAYSAAIQEAQDAAYEVTRAEPRSASRSLPATGWSWPTVTAWRT